MVPPNGMSAWLTGTYNVVDIWTPCVSRQSLHKCRASTTLPITSITPKLYPASEAAETASSSKRSLEDVSSVASLISSNKEISHDCNHILNNLDPLDDLPPEKYLVGIGSEPIRGGVVLYSNTSEQHWQQFTTSARLFKINAVIDSTALPFHQAPSSQVHISPSAAGGIKAAKSASTGRVTKNTSGHSRKKTASRPSAKPLVLASANIGQISSIIEFPDFFFAWKPIKYAMYKWDCSRGHSRLCDFFSRNLEYHWKAGHFHEEFGSPEAATAAYWRTRDASSDTNPEDPEYQKLVYKAKLEALSGVSVPNMPVCIDHGTHVIHSVRVRPFQHTLLPQPDTRPEQLRQPRLSFIASSAERAVVGTNESMQDSGSQNVIRGAIASSATPANTSRDSVDVLVAEMRASNSQTVAQMSALSSQVLALTSRITASNMLVGELRSRLSYFEALHGEPLQPGPYAESWPGQDAADTAMSEHTRNLSSPELASVLLQSSTRTAVTGITSTPPTSVSRSIGSSQKLP